MPPKNSPSQIIIKNVTAFLCIGTLIWLILLICSASTFRTANISNYSLHIGPLTLNTFSRHAAAYGQRISISSEPGLLIYALILTTAGLMTGLYQVKIKSK